MVYVFLAEGFEEVEALTPVDILRRAGLEVVTVGVGGRQITGSHGIVVVADICDGALSDELPEAMVLPGGQPGTTHLEQSETVQRLLKRCVQADVWIGAICAAPSILGHQGFLQGKEATAFPSFQKELEDARLCPDYVCRDGHILTARGMGVSTQFGLWLVEALRGREKALEIANAIQMKPRAIEELFS